MAPPRQFRGSRRGSAPDSAAWAIVSVALLAVVVIALASVALTQNRSVSEAGASPGASPTAGPTEVLPVETEAPPPPAASPLPAPGRMIAARDANEAVRAIATVCPEPTTIELTSDAGATWEPAEPAAVAAVQRVTTGSDAFVALIGLATEGCVPTYERSFTSGAAWERTPDELAASWFVDPSNRSRVHAPAGDRDAPCGAVVQVAVVDENSAAVLCDDRSAHATIDGGATWLPSASVAGAAAITAGGSGYRVAVINENGCVGAQLIELGVTEAGLTPGGFGACLPATVGAGEAAVASGGDGATWLWAGDVLARSIDGGASWL